MNHLRRRGHSGWWSSFWPALLCVAGSASGQVERATLAALDGEASSGFGNAVAIEGDTAVVSAVDSLEGKGVVYVFGRHVGGPEQWGHVRKLFEPEVEPFDFYGSALAVSGDCLLVGARSDDDLGEDTGAVYVYMRNQGGPDNWGFVKKLMPNPVDPSGTDWFGRSVAIEGDIAIVGAPFADEPLSNNGLVYVFQRDRGGIDNWGLVTTLSPEDVEIHLGFGEAVSIDRGQLLVGSRQIRSDQVQGVHVFYRHAGGADGWGLVNRIDPPDEDIYRFGEALEVNGDLAIVSASLRIFIFSRNLGGPDRWGLMTHFRDVSLDRQTSIRSLMITDRYAVIGRPSDDVAGLDSGSAYLFLRNRNGRNRWGLVGGFRATGTNNYDRFASAIASEGHQLLIGERLGGDGKGRAYIFDMPEFPEDCDGDGQMDQDELLSDPSLDCQVNGIPDACEIADGSSMDENGDGVPDECRDCNSNGVSDFRDLFLADSADCNDNQVPDECEIDCDANGRPDACDIADDPELDCDDSGVLDTCEDIPVDDCDDDGIIDYCEIASGAGSDFNENGVLDACEDCNGNGQSDVDDVLLGFSPDCNENLYPDECEPDCNDDGIPDRCDLMFFSTTTGRMSPFGSGIVPRLVIPNLPMAVSDVVFEFEASADLEGTMQKVDLTMNGFQVATVFQDDAHTCPGRSDREALVYPAGFFNILRSLAPNGEAVFELIASDPVDATACGGDAFISMTIDYRSEGYGDLNGNGVPDECDPPVCHDHEATIWVDIMGNIVGGPLDGRRYFGILIGTPGDDVIMGTSGNDIIIGVRGEDVICGNGGDDRIIDPSGRKPTRRALRPRTNTGR